RRFGNRRGAPAERIGRLRCALRILSPAPGSRRHIDTDAAIQPGPDYRILIAARVLRGFAFGMAAAGLGIHLEQRGLGPGAVGGVLAIGVLSGSLYGVPLAALAGRIGRRKVLAVIGLLMALTGLDL